MARKTFISYKFSEAQDLRDKIIESLGKDSKFYTGETSDSPDLTDLATGTIKDNLKDMIYNTSVTIVIISPNILKSKWIDWELEYSLKKIKRGDKTSQTNGIIAVIQKNNSSYNWFIENKTNVHGLSTASYKNEKIYDVIKKNHFNSSPPIWHCDECKTYCNENGSYISYVKEDRFLENPREYIEKAYEKSQNLEKYILVKQK